VRNIPTQLHAFQANRLRRNVRGQRRRPRYDLRMGKDTSSEDPRVRIRLGTVEDIPLLGPIDVSANPLFGDWGHPEFAGDGESIPDDVAHKAVGEGRLLVCELIILEGNDEVVGWAVMFDRPNGETSIGQISIHANLMGNGYGGPLLVAAIDRCRRLERTAIVLNTQTDVPWNRPWYERFGFVVVPRPDWNLDMHETEQEQTEARLDWSTRVHMRLVLD
jgi:GNAT superfamily N-acetyltransferase